MTVQDAHGAPATIPFWLGEAPGRTIELSTEVSEFRLELARRAHESTDAAARWLGDECSVSTWGARQAVNTSMCT